MKRIYLAWAVIALSLIAGAACFLAPVPSSPTYSAFSFYLFLIMTVMTAVLFSGASVIFLSSLNGFTKSLQRGYLLLCIGFILLGLAFIQLPLLVYGGSVEELFKGGTYSAILFLVAFTFIILGIRKFAKLFGVRGLTTQVWYYFIPPLLLAFIYAVLPHAPTQTNELKFDINNGFLVFNAWVDAMVVTLLFKIKRAAGVQYAEAFAWMVISFTVMLVAVVGDLILLLPVGDKQWFLIGAAPIIPLYIAGNLMVRAAYSFSKITANNQSKNLTATTARNFFGKTLSQSAEDKVSSVDIVVYAANLVSQPQQIDNLLETVRSITSNSNAQALSDDDQSNLQQTYLAIEDYLVNKEPVRTFTKESLRQMIADDLKLTNAPNTFWSGLATS